MIRDPKIGTQTPGRGSRGLFFSLKSARPNGHFQSPGLAYSLPDTFTYCEHGYAIFNSIIYLFSVVLVSYEPEKFVQPLSDRLRSRSWFGLKNVQQEKS